MVITALATSSNCMREPWNEISLVTFFTIPSCVGALGRTINGSKKIIAKIESFAAFTISAPKKV
jgi:hypothetical protein